MTRLWTLYLVTNLVAVAVLVGIGWAIVYYMAWIPFNEAGGLARLLELLAKPDIWSTLWWREFLALAFDVLIFVVAAIGTWWTLGHFAVEARRQGLWRRYYRSEEGRRDVWVLRLTLWQRIQHLWMLITFAVTAYTGFAMHLANNPYWKDLFGVNRDLYVTVHVAAGWAMGVLVVLHFAYYGVRALLAKLSGRSLLEEFPMLQFYTLTFLKNFARRMAWLVTGRVRKPLVHKYDCEQLFEYWGIYWGIAVLGIPGAIMSIWGPQVLNGVLWVMHYKEAILAVVFILMVHIAYAHFMPTVFPVDTTFIHGRMPARRVKEEHPLWYKQLVERGVIREGEGAGKDETRA